jgi:hypothetical protein
VAVSLSHLFWLGATLLMPQQYYLTLPLSQFMYVMGLVPRDPGRKRGRKEPVGSMRDFQGIEGAVCSTIPLMLACNPVVFSWTNGRQHTTPGTAKHPCRFSLRTKMINQMWRLRPYSQVNPCYQWWQTRLPRASLPLCNYRRPRCILKL